MSMKYFLVSILVLGAASATYAHESKIDLNDIRFKCSIAGPTKERDQTLFEMGKGVVEFRWAHSVRLDIANNDYRYITASLGNALTGGDGYLTMAIGQSDSLNVDGASMVEAEGLKIIAKARAKLSSLDSEVELTDGSANVTFTCKQAQAQSQ